MKIEKAVGLILLGAAILGLWILRDSSPALRLFAASIGLIWVIKVAALLWQWQEKAGRKSPYATSLFLFTWPGISLTGFTERKAYPPEETGAGFMEAWLCFLAGISLLILVALAGKGNSTVLNYVALLAVFLTIHLGFIEILADGLRILGFSPRSIFDRPYLANSLRDFWSNRWNRAFVDMNKIFFLKPMRGKIPGPILRFSIFLVSGLLHELGISYPDNSSWGKPLLYFVVQGIGMEIEKHRAFSRPLVWIWILLPLPLLFTPSFTNLFLGGLSALIAETAQSMNYEQLLRKGLFVGGLAHMLVLCASIQVPGKLAWNQELKKLSTLNRKVFWTYGAYIFSIILFIAAVSIFLSRIESLDSEAALLWIAFIAIFWWARVLTDFFYFSHEDWPKGPLFTVGHICLTTLFIGLALLYSVLGLIWIWAR